MRELIIPIDRPLSSQSLLKTLDVSLTQTPTDIIASLTICRILISISRDSSKSNPEAPEVVEAGRCPMHAARHKLVMESQT
jgi:hypothetical protein